jgi:hypothetical protein
MDIQMDGRNCVLINQESVGEYVSARKFPNMTKELILKASMYNMFATKKNHLDRKVRCCE